MLRLWVSVPYIGTGTDNDPFRPDLSALGDAIPGWSLAGTDGTDAIVYVIPPTDMSRGEVERAVEVLHGEDEQDNRNRRHRIPDAARDAAQNRAKALGLKRIDMDHVDVNPRGLVG